ncbi:MAG TPA: RlpA-like double-psi beta-barrel domain-containing protein [Acidocella sp.]|nr:RlpA-like double-psi beta-barrel domain-containing protein [Acidocella sp.]
MINRYILGVFVALASCAHQASLPPQGPVKFTVGNPYQAGGEWRYPRVYNSYDVTGLSTVIGNNAAPYTADNEVYDTNALAAASPVLQLPAIVTVTNLVNGYSMDVRVNDRGPDIPGRIIAVTPRVARLLGYPPGGVVEVGVKLNETETAALDGALGQGPKLAAAPVAGVTAQNLAPPGGGTAGAVQNLTPTQNDASQAQGVRLTGTVMRTTPAAGPLFVQIPGFGRESDAFRVMERLGGMSARIVPVSGGDRTLYAVNVGPYHSVADADAALQQILARGITDPEIIVR